MLWGHRAPVTSVAVTALHDTVLSASTTGTVLVHSLIKGRILHRLHLQPPSLPPPLTPPSRTLVAAVALSAVTGAMVVHTVECKPPVRPGSAGPAAPAEDKDACLVAYSHNGERLDTCTVRGVLHTLQARRLTTPFGIRPASFIRSHPREPPTRTNNLHSHGMHSQGAVRRFRSRAPMHTSLPRVERARDARGGR